MRNIWFGTIIVLTIISVGTSAFAIPIYVVDDYRSFCGGYSSKIVVMDSEAPHNEIILNAGTGKRMTDIAITPSGSQLYTITGDECPALYRFDIDDGHLLNSWNLGTGGTGFKNALVAESETSLLLMSNDKTNIWRINLNADGNYVSTSNLGNIGLYSSGDLAISPDGVLYLSSVDLPNSLTAKNRLYKINLSGSPVATEIGIIHKTGHNPRTGWLTQIYGLAFDENGVLYGGRGAVGVAEDVYTISLLNASATFAWTMQCEPSTGINGFASVPEPATIALLGLGVLALLRKRKA
ncbi:MAG: PEP-CTERM sorting domain-containing protein [Sedimentisphaerales bacterium]|nr:PEP-CTERM sorting domain-containing protein [Sedimentisphaerales bacterium]